MATGLSQDVRFARFKTPLGKDALNVTRFDCTEGLSELFEMTLEAVGTDSRSGPPIDFNQIIGKECTTSVDGKSATRHFSGILTSADWIGQSDSYYIYRMTLRPWFWLHTRTSNSRIFSNQATPEIIQSVLGEKNFGNFELRLTESYAPREYTVQYRESDFDFICRLMEEDGMYYFFEHTEDKHTMVIADAKSAHTDVPGLSEVLYVDRLMSPRVDRESFTDFSVRRNFSVGKVALNDYD